MTIEVIEECAGDKGLTPLIQLLAQIQNFLYSQPFASDNEVLEIIKYQDIRIAYELLKYDEQLAIQIANVIRTHTGK